MRHVDDARDKGATVLAGMGIPSRAQQFTVQSIVVDKPWIRATPAAAKVAGGYLKITGRLKEMFIVGGSNAYPAEIERLLQGIDSIKQAVVVGVPDRRLGEVGFAFVQLHEGQSIEEAELVSRCRAMMADYKVPRHVRVVDEFPRTTTGKIQRFILQRQAREELASKT